MASSVRPMNTSHWGVFCAFYPPSSMCAPNARARSGSAAATLGVCQMRTRNLQRPLFVRCALNTGRSLTAR